MSDQMRPEMQEFMKERSRATAKLYDDFIAARGLDIDGANWTDKDREEYDAAADKLIAEWKAKQQQLLASLDNDDAEGK